MRAILLLILLYCSSTIGIVINETESAQIKTKRTLNHHLGSAEDTYSKPVYYTDNVPAQSVNTNVENQNSGNVYVKSFPFPTAPVKTVFGPEVPAKVAAQQVLYEFQQTPTNAVSNVHVKQLFQPLNHDPNGSLNPSNAETSESVATPVQHSAYTNHGQNYAQVSFNPHPLYNIQPHHVQQQHYIPGKYLYINGRMVYQPNQNQNQNIQHQNQNPLSYNNYNANPAYVQNQQKIPVVNFANRYPIPQQRHLPSITTAAPIIYGKFTPPAKLQSITNPMNYQSTTTAAPIENEEQNEEEEDEDNARIQDEEAEEDEGDEGRNSERERYEDEEDERQDRHPHFGRYSFDEEEEPEKYERYRNDDEEAEEEEDDTRRGSSRIVPSKTKKYSQKKSKKSNPDKYNKSYKTSYSEGYSTSSKYEHPGKNKKKASKAKPKKTSKYSGKKNHNKSGGIEGRYSEHVPVTHKHKIFKENKWFVTQNTNDKRDDE